MECVCSLSAYQPTGPNSISTFHSTGDSEDHPRRKCPPTPPCCDVRLAPMLRAARLLVLLLLAASPAHGARLVARSHRRRADGPAEEADAGTQGHEAGEGEVSE